MAGAVRVVSPEDVQPVAQRREDVLQTFPHRPGGAGEVHDEGTLPDARGGAAEHGPVREPGGIGPHGLGDAGVGRSTTSMVASGVQSRGEKPVPPVVTTSAAASSSHRRASSADSMARSSGSMT